MDRVLVLLLPELEGEEGVLAPWYVLLNVDLVLVVGQVGVTLATHGTEVNLIKDKRSGCLCKAICKIIKYIQ